MKLGTLPGGGGGGSRVPLSGQPGEPHQNLGWAIGGKKWAPSLCSYGVATASSNSSSSQTSASFSSAFLFLIFPSS